jgi:hypothetical protein
MNRTLWISLIGLLFLTGIVGNALGKPGESSSAIDPRVDKLIRQFNEHHKKLTHYSFTVIDTIDEVQENGQKLQFSHKRKVTVSQPNKLQMESVGDLSNRSIWKDDNTLTILDRDKNVYGQVKFTGTIDEMMDAMLTRYGFTTPLADLLSSDIYTDLMENAQTGQYLGLHNVGELKCHHLAVTQENIDWQAWIEQGDKPRLRKLVITYKQSQGEPQYTLVLQNITILPQVNKEKFSFKPPAGAEKIRFMPVEKSESDNASTAQ